MRRRTPHEACNACPPLIPASLQVFIPPGVIATPGLERPESGVGHALCVRFPVRRRYVAGGFGVDKPDAFPGEGATREAPAEEPEFGGRRAYLYPGRYFHFYLLYEPTTGKTCWLPEGYLA
jgi:hypothetical protein